MIALIDADELSYKAALAYQNTYYGVYKDDKKLWRCRYKEEASESVGNRDDLEIKVEIEVLELSGLKKRINTSISSILSNTGSNDLRFYLSGDNNFRCSIATLLPYKGNRPTEKPFHLESVRDEFRSRGAEYVDYLEADDLLSANNSLITKDTIICSSDKDLRTVPSLNYNITTKKCRVISDDEARYNFWYQVLIGDAVDNIPSPYLLGPKVAEKILEKLIGETDKTYYKTILPFYSKYLFAKDKGNSYKTKWMNGREESVEEVIWEVGNLLYMHRTLDENERWTI